MAYAGGVRPAGYAVAALAVAGLSCRVSLFTEGTHYRCDDGACPPGQTCGPDRFCYAEILDAPVTVDGPVADAPASDASTVVDGPPGPDAPAPDARPADAPPVDAPPPDGPTLDAPWPANIALNAGMENGMADWTPYLATGASVTSGQRSGARAYKICKTATGATSDYSVYEDVINTTSSGTISAGDHYVARLWVRATGVEPAPPSLRLTLRERGGAAALLDHDGPTLSPVPTTWTELTAEGTIAQADRVYLVLIGLAVDAPDGSCFLIDDAYVGLWP